MVRCSSRRQKTVNSRFSVLVTVKIFFPFPVNTPNLYECSCNEHPIADNDRDLKIPKPRAPGPSSARPRQRASERGWSERHTACRTPTAHTHTRTHGTATVDRPAHAPLAARTPTTHVNDAPARASQPAAPTHTHPPRPARGPIHHACMHRASEQPSTDAPHASARSFIHAFSMRLTARWFSRCTQISQSRSSKRTLTHSLAHCLVYSRSAPLIHPHPSERPHRCIGYAVSSRGAEDKLFTPSCSATIGLPSVHSFSNCSADLTHAMLS